MPEIKTTQRLYFNRDKTKLLPEGHADAAFLQFIPGRSYRFSGAEYARMKALVGDVENATDAAPPAPADPEIPADSSNLDDDTNPPDDPPEE